MAGIILNEDDSHFFSSRSSEEMTLAGLRALVDAYAGKDVRQIVFNPNATRTSYASKVWDNAWDGFSSCPPEDIWMRRFVENARLLDEQGINPYVEWINFSRERNISPWISMRMNDVHFANQPDSGIHSQFWKDNPEYRRISPARPFSGCWADRALDFGRAEVRQRAMLLIREYFELFDMDGLELDWMRWGYYFRPGFEQQGRELLIEFMEQVKSLAVEYSSIRSREIKIGVRVPARIEAAIALGLDAIEWARRGFVDLVVPTAFFSTTDFDMPIASWRRFLGDNVQIAAGIEILTKPYRNAKYRMFSPPAVVFAQAANYLWQGADAIYLFNYMDSETTIDESREEYRNILDNAGSLDKVLRQPRRHVVTFADTFAPGQEPAACLLPARCYTDKKTNCFRLPVGKLRDDATAWVVLGFETKDPVPELNIYVNGTGCSVEPLNETLKLPKEIVQTRAYRIPGGVLHDGYNVIEAEITKDVDLTICWTEIYIT